MKIFVFFFVFVSFNSLANIDCDKQVDDIKNQAELFVIELNMDRVEMLFHIRGFMNIDSVVESRQALDQELHVSIMEVLIKEKSNQRMISQIAKLTESFHVLPLQVDDFKIEELNAKLAQRLTTGK
jgi:hypothetical protein